MSALTRTTARWRNTERRLAREWDDIERPSTTERTLLDATRQLLRARSELLTALMRARKHH
jgi:hypothetical protein